MPKGVELIRVTRLVPVNGYIISGMKRRIRGSRGISTSDPELLVAALAGYEQQRSEIEGKIAELRWRLGGRLASVPAGSADRTLPARKRGMSAAGRRRIAAAQRKRWAAFHKTHTPAAARKQRRRLSGR